MEPLWDVAPYDGWMLFYSPADDELSPFHADRHAPEDDQRYFYTFEAHPAWEHIGSESLLLKILYANYADGYAVLELLGEWNDLFDNDFKLLAENCLTYLVDGGIRRFVLVCENVFHMYLQDDDYYTEFSEELGDEGWMVLLRARTEVLAELQRTGISRFFYWNSQWEELRWRKMKPWELMQLVQHSLQRTLPATGAPQLPLVPDPLD